MALRDILVCVDPTEAATVRLRLAADLAGRHGSHVTALFVHEWSRAQLDLRKAAELGLVSAERLHRVDHDAESLLDTAADGLRSALATLTREHGVQGELRVIDGIASTAVPQYARYADLCILGRDQPEGPASINYTFSEQLLFVTGRPVILVPAIAPAKTLGRQIAIAWNSSRPAARSLNDALPLIEDAERIFVLMINPSGCMAGHEGPPGEQIIEHLRRHGANAEAIAIEHVPPGAIAETLLSEAGARGADMIVAGAFGHPRLWEKMLGGVTYDLMARMNLPIFMSH
jgi:nucleotide-binding universal stress UspA family protein